MLQNAVVSVHGCGKPGFVALPTDYWSADHKLTTTIGEAATVPAVSMRTHLVGCLPFTGASVQSCLVVPLGLCSQGGRLRPGWLPGYRARSLHHTAGCS